MLAIVLLFIGLLYVLISIPFLRQKVKPNNFCGFRTAKTLSSEDIWYKANIYMAKELIRLGIVFVICGVLWLGYYFFTCEIVVEEKDIVRQELIGIGIFVSLVGGGTVLLLVRCFKVVK